MLLHYEFTRPPRSSSEPQTTDMVGGENRSKAEKSVRLESPPDSPDPQQQQPYQPLPPREVHEDQQKQPLCPPPYLKSAVGIVKLIEMVLCLMTFVCSLAGKWSWLGGGWVEFVSMFAFTVTMVLFMLHMIKAVPRCLVNRPVEFIISVVFAVLFLIAAIISSIRATDLHGAVGATAFFSFACVAMYGTVDAYFQIYAWRSLTAVKRNETSTTVSSDARLTIDSQPRQPPSLQAAV